MGQAKWLGKWKGLGGLTEERETDRVLGGQDPELGNAVRIQVW